MTEDIIPRTKPTREEKILENVIDDYMNMTDEELRHMVAIIDVSVSEIEHELNRLKARLNALENRLKKLERRRRYR